MQKPTEKPLKIYGPLVDILRCIKSVGRHMSVMHLSMLCPTTPPTGQTMGDLTEEGASTVGNLITSEDESPVTSFFEGI